MAKLRIGTCSRKYDSWRGLIYSQDKHIDYLEEYANHYDTVEIDQWFWSLHGKNKVTLPQPNIVQSYVQVVPKHFKFSIKIPNSITLSHFYNKSKTYPLIPNPHFLSTELFDDFLARLEPMFPHLGPLMFQFEYLNKQKMSSLDEFIVKFERFVSKLPSQFSLALEIRNPNYLKKEYFDFLNRNNLSHVFLQGYYMPPIVTIYNKFHPLIKDLTVIRLHGPDRKGIEKRTKKQWNQIVEPKDREISEIQKMINMLLHTSTDVYLNINNHYEGSAPLTINKFNTSINKK